MDEHLKQLGLDLLGRGLDFIVAKATAPKKSHNEERLEQIDRTLEALKSAPEDGHRWTSAFLIGPESRKETPLSTGTTVSTQIPQSPTRGVAEPSADISTAMSPPGRSDDEYCIGCGPNNHLAKAQNHIEEALRLSRGKGEIITDIVAPRIQDAVSELGGYEDGDVKHMREKATGALAEILEDILIQTRALRNFLRYDISGLEIGKGKLEDLEKAAVWIRKLRQLGYYSVMVEVSQKAEISKLG